MGMLAPSERSPEGVALRVFSTPLQAFIDLLCSVERGDIVMNPLLLSMIQAEVKSVTPSSLGVLWHSPARDFLMPDPERPHAL